MDNRTSGTEQRGGGGGRFGMPNWTAIKNFHVRVQQLVSLPEFIAFAVGHATTKPTCNSSFRDALMVTRGGAGVEDTLNYCRKNSADAYSWLGVGAAGPTGPTGATGPAGPTGPTGATGPAGGVTLLHSQTSVQAGDTIANTVTPTDFASSAYTLPANTLTAGDILRIRASGTWRNNNTTPTFNFDLMFGGTAISSFVSGPITQTANSTARGWRVEFELVCKTTGAPGTSEVGGIATFFYGNKSTESGDFQANQQAIVTTGTNAIALRATWGTANANNTITMRQFTIDLAA